MLLHFRPFFKIKIKIKIKIAFNTKTAKKKWETFIYFAMVDVCL